MIRSSVHHAQLSVSLEPVVPSFSHYFPCSFLCEHREQVQQCRRLLFVWCGSCHHSRRLSRRLQSKAGYVGSRVPAYPLNVKSQSSKPLRGHIWFRFPDSHVFRTRSRHRLSHRSHSLCESRHCRIHSSIRRLLSDILHPRIEFLKLTSQYVDFLSSSHDHSIPPGQDKMLRYPATRSATNAMCTRVTLAVFLMT